MLIAVCIFISSNLLAQVGINIATPRRLVHIDGAGNTLASSTDISSEVADDVIIDNAGNVGLGLLNPTVKLHIDSRSKATPTVPISGFRLQDGSQALNYGMVSDANGFGRWASLDFSGYTIVNYRREKSEFTLPASSGSSIVYSNLYIDFPEPGKYLVSIGAKVEIMRTGTAQAIFGLLRPNNNPADYFNSVTQFKGAYPVSASYISSKEQTRIILCQEIEVVEGELRAYLMLEFAATDFSGAGEIYTSWGNGGIRPEAHRTGGSFVKIN